MFINPELKIITKSIKKSNFFCDICSYPLVMRVDFMKHDEYGCCFECYMTFAEARKEEWKKGYRPDQTKVDEYIYLRKKMCISTIEPMEKKDGV